MKNTILTIIFIFCFSFLFADTIEKKAYTTKKTTIAPVIDGLLDTEIWEQVEWAGDFIQSKPNEGDSPSQQTAFKILYDDDNLYVFIKSFDNEPKKISHLLARRDNFPGDFVEINIDSDLDRQTAFSFTASASGVKSDQAVSEDGKIWDPSWNPIWYLKTSIDKEGWNAEFSIPFSQLRFGEKENHIWGIQVLRYVFRKEEFSDWQIIPQDSPGTIHLFSELHGISNIKPKRQVDITPYTLANVENYKEEVGNPYADGSYSSFAMGVDGKIGLSNDMTLDFTINPDFGQVEADPSEVNLTAFESYFFEQRPFFVEGKSIFDFRPSSGSVISSFNSDNLFYSRRIGRRPHFYPHLRENEYANMPEASSIIGAFKLSGKTKNGLSVGIMESVTTEENAKVSYLGTERNVAVEPMTNYFVARVKKDFNKGETTFGGIITAVNRDITSSDLYFLPNSAYTGGLDFKHFWKDRTYFVDLNANFSHVRGHIEAITNLQKSSARYYQRPDAEHLVLDETKTELSGTAATVKVGKKGNGKWRFESSVTLRSPGFEINDIGYMQSSDVIHHGTWLGYKIQKPFGIFENFNLNNNYWVTWDFNGKQLSFSENINFNSKLKNKWSFNGSFTHNGENYCTSALRGGPSLLMPSQWSYNANINSDQRKKLYLNIGFYLSRSQFDYTRSDNFWVGLTYKPTDALSISVDPRMSNTTNELQYIGQAETNGETRYILGAIGRKTLGLNLRLNYSITPNLTIQYYGQPFTSAGDYAEFKMITNSQADKYEDRFAEFSTNQISYSLNYEVYSIDEDEDGSVDYTFKKPNFNFAELKSNLVIRWEYLPGSTFYLVWSQGRTMANSKGEFNLQENMNDLFEVHPRDIFLLKFSYRISL